MFRSKSGFKAQYHDLTMLAISEFNEWKVLVYGPGTTIHGTHQFSEAKAKEHALTIAQTYIHEIKHDELPVLADAAWVPVGDHDWLNWSS